MLLFVVVFFFFKQKTAYEMRISDWSSDVCSSDLEVGELMPVVSIIGRALRRSLFAVASHAVAQQSLFLGRSKVHAISVGRPRSSPEQAVPADRKSGV